MRLLLDTHAFVWWLQDSPRLGHGARRAVADTRSLIHVSAASIWELAIKSALGKVNVGRAAIPAEITANGFIELSIRAAHAWRASSLPRHHDDPFDRMLVAQAQLEDLTLVTHDSVFEKYEVPVLSA
ncbi:MAG: type II toxin-antitoxin system VapC family toxin [Thermoanaerobaculia bacterium]